MNKRGGIPACIGVVCLAFALPARAAQNLLADPNFNGTVSPFAAVDAIYDADHSATADGTGSAAVFAPAGGAVELQQCVTGIVGGSTYSFGGSLRIPSEDPFVGAAHFAIAWHAASDCSDSPISVSNSSTLSDPSGPTDTWVTLSAAALAPAAAIAATFELVADETGPATAGTAPRIRPQGITGAFFDFSADNLFLDPDVVAGLPMLNGVGFAVLIAGIAGAALVCLKR